MTLAPVSAVERLRNGRTPLLFYPLLALVSFPTLGLLLWGKDALVYAHDVFDIPRIGVGSDWLAAGLGLWNVHLTGGDPLLVQQAIGPLAFDVPLAWLVGPFWSFVIDGWLLAAVAGISMHLFLRDCLRLSTLAVVGGATIFLFCYWQPIIGFAIPATPLLLWLLEGALRASRTRWRFVLAHVLVGAFVLYNGQSQIVVLVALLEAVYVLAVAAGLGVGVRRGLAVIAGVWALAFALYGPVLLTQLVALPESQRTVWYLYPIPLFEAIRTTIGFYSRIVIGVPDGAIFGSPDVYGTFFLGAAGLPLVVLGAVRSGHDRRRWLLVGLLIAIPLLDLGVALARPLQEQAGLLKTFQFDRIRHFVPFALVVSGALGLDVVASALAVGRRAWPSARWRRLAVFLALVPVGVSLAFAIGNLAGARVDPTRPGPEVVGWLLAIGALGLGLAGICVVVLGTRRIDPRLPRAAGLLLVLIALILERGIYAQAERLMGGDLATWRESLDPTPGQAFLLRQPGIGIDRVMTFGDDPNRMGALGLLQADGYETIYPLAYHALFGQLIRPQLDIDPARRVYFDRWGNRAQAFGPRVDAALVSLVGVRWLYVRGPPPPAFNPSLYAGLPWTPTVPGIVARYQDAQVTVYEVPSVLPRAFVAGGLAIAPNDAAVTASLGAATLSDLRGQAFVAGGSDAAALGAALGGAGTPGPAGTATITSYTSDRVSIDVSATRPGVLVFSDVWAPGWVADVDGTRTPISRVDEAFRGVAVGPTTHHVVFTYVPIFTYVGFVVAGCALALAAGVALVVRARDRRRPIPTPSARGPRPATAVPS
ncbi:MAG: DUF6044 family protein [Candidatus Limnocylindrales bacterium]